MPLLYALSSVPGRFSNRASNRIRDYNYVHETVSLIGRPVDDGIVILPVIGQFEWEIKLVRRWTCH